MLYAAGAIVQVTAQGLPAEQPQQLPRTNPGHKLQFSPHKENRLSVLLKSVFFIASSSLFKAASQYIIPVAWIHPDLSGITADMGIL